VPQPSVAQRVAAQATLAGTPDTGGLRAFRLARIYLGKHGRSVLFGSARRFGSGEFQGFPGSIQVGEHHLSLFAPAHQGAEGVGARELSGGTAMATERRVQPMVRFATSAGQQICRHLGNCW
jgi:hypothetical protein